MITPQERAAMKEFGLRMREARERLEMRQEDLAKKLSLMQKQISRYETGQTSPSLEKLNHIADVLDVSIDWLAGRTDNPKGIEVLKSPLTPEAIEAARLVESLDSPADQRFAVNMLSFTVTELRLRSRVNSSQ